MCLACTFYFISYTRHIRLGKAQCAHQGTCDINIRFYCYLAVCNRCRGIGIISGIRIEVIDIISNITQSRTISIKCFGITTNIKSETATAKLVARSIQDIGKFGVLVCLQYISCLVCVFHNSTYHAGTCHITCCRT